MATFTTIEFNGDRLRDIRECPDQQFKLAILDILRDPSNRAHCAYVLEQYGLDCAMLVTRSGMDRG
jgi:hypothetical protein